MRFLELILNPFLMRCCIEMKRIHHILTPERTLCHNVHILRPGRCSDNDHGVLAVLSDRTDNGLGVWLDMLLPGDGTVRLVADLLDHIVLTGVLLRHLCKELLSLRLMLVRVALAEHMPVNDHIHTKLCGIPHTLLHFLDSLCTIAL